MNKKAPAPLRVAHWSPMRHLLVPALLMGVIGQSAGQQIHKCVDGSGATSYQSAPCPSPEQTKQVYQTIKYQTAPDAYVAPYVSDRDLARQREALQPSQPRPATPAPQRKKRPDYLAQPGRRSSDPLAPVEGREVTDQYGNRYTEREESNFVRDEKTGKLCYRYGSSNQFLQCN